MFCSSEKTRKLINEVVLITGGGSERVNIQKVDIKRSFFIKI